MKSKIKNKKSKTRRRGVALMAVVVTLVILALMMSAIAWQMVATGRVLQHRQYQLQAAWLARAGIEHAAARLLEQPNGYRGETVELMELSTVTIEVNDEPTRPGATRVTCEVRYPTDVVAPVSRKQIRIFMRVIDGENVRLECIASNEEE